MCLWIYILFLLHLTLEFEFRLSVRLPEFYIKKLFLCISEVLVSNFALSLAYSSSTHCDPLTVTNLSGSSDFVINMW